MAVLAFATHALQIIAAKPYATPISDDKNAVVDDLVRPRTSGYRYTRFAGRTCIATPVDSFPTMRAEARGLACVNGG